MPVREERWQGKSQNFTSCEKLQGNCSCSSNKDETRSGLTSFRICDVLVEGVLVVINVYLLDYDY